VEAPERGGDEGVRREEAKAEAEAGPFEVAGPDTGPVGDRGGIGIGIRTGARARRDDSLRVNPVMKREREEAIRLEDEKR
jgi:hypothetical protein